MSTPELGTAPSQLQQWRRKAPKCLFCMDVRLGTMILALFQIVLHIFVLVALVVAILHPQAMHHLMSRSCLRNMGHGFFDGFFHENKDHNQMNLGMDREYVHRHDHHDHHNLGHAHHHDHMNRHHFMDFINPENKDAVSPKLLVPSLPIHNNNDHYESNELDKVDNDLALKSKIGFSAFPININHGLLNNGPVNQLGPFEFHRPDHILNLRLISFGHRETIIFKNNNNGEPTLFLTRMFNFPSAELKDKDQQIDVPAREISPKMNVFPSIRIMKAEPITKSENPSNSNNKTSPHWFFKRCQKHRYLKLMFVALSLSFCFLLFYGVKRRRPLLLIPYFTMQVFGYIMVLFVVVGYLSYLPHIKYWLEFQCHFPLKRTLLAMNDFFLGLIIILISVMVLTLKAALIGMVWRCYHHLRIEKRIEIMERTRGLISNSDVVLTLQPDIEDKKLLELENNCVDLPKYEKCLEIPANSFMPPPYFEQVKEEKEETK